MSRRARGTGTITRGYIQLRVGKDRPFLHRHIMEQHLGRKLHEHEHVHHIDGNRLNNSLDNLKLLSPGQHTKLHWAGATARKAHLASFAKKARQARLTKLTKRGHTPETAKANRNRRVTGRRRAKRPWHIDYTRLTPPLDTESWIEAVYDHHPP